MSGWFHRIGPWSRSRQPDSDGVDFFLIIPFDLEVEAVMPLRVAPEVGLLVSAGGGAGSREVGAQPEVALIDAFVGEGRRGFRVAPDGAGPGLVGKRRHIGGQFALVAVEFLQLFGEALQSFSALPV